MLANHYSSAQHAVDLQHYWVSEKYDGVRAYWNGKQFVSRQGHSYNAPSWYIKGLSNYPLDGELWLGRGQFDRLSGIVRTTTPNDDDWRLVRFMVFDLPANKKIFDERLKELEGLLGLPPWVIVAEQWKVDNEKELLEQLEKITSLGAEGLMLHDGRSLYSSQRSDDLIKLKLSMDNEGIVLSYVEGKGKYKGKMGSLWVETDVINEQGIRTKVIFKIGTGFSDSDRENPPPIGSIITYKYSGLTSKGTPRFARYWRVRALATEK